MHFSTPVCLSSRGVSWQHLISNSKWNHRFYWLAGHRSPSCFHSGGEVSGQFTSDTCRTIPQICINNTPRYVSTIPPNMYHSPLRSIGEFNKVVERFPLASLNIRWTVLCLTGCPQSQFIHFPSCWCGTEELQYWLWALAIYSCWLLLTWARMTYLEGG